MKTSTWRVLALLLLLAARARAQSLTGVWQGVEMAPGSYTSEAWASVLTIRPAQGAVVRGELYQEASGLPEFRGTFQMSGARTAAGVQLRHAGIVSETHPRDTYWCLGTIRFTYDPALEKLTGRAAFPAEQECGTSQYVLYRVKRKSAPAVAAGALSTLRVSGRNVRWFADPDLTKPLASGNTYRTRLSKKTTFYITQGFYPTERSPVVPVTVAVSGTAPRQTPPVARTPAAPAPIRPALPVPAPTPTVPPAPAPTPAPPTPMVLPTVLFRLTTAELLPEAGPALDQLATALKGQPALRIRVAGHTDHLGEPGKNQLLSEQRATAVKNYLVRAGVAAGHIETAGYGDTRPLYPSPDARNRRVEVEELK